MLQKLAIAVIFISTASLIYAAPASRSYHQRVSYKGETVLPPPKPISVPSSAHFSFGGGAYVGLDVGLRTNYSSNPSAYKGVEGTLLAGIGFLARNGLYLAEEIFIADGAQLQGYSNTDDSKPGVKSSWSVGLSLLPGYLILDNVLGYARLGVVKTYFSNAGGNANGGQAGLGLQVALTQSWDLRGEYIYSFYGSPSGSCASPNDSAVKSDQFNIGAIYKFM